MKDDSGTKDYYKYQNPIETSPFVQIDMATSTKNIKKKALCWLFNNQFKLSSDRNPRVKQSGKILKKKLRVSHNYHWKILAVYYEESWYIGRILEKMPDENFKIKCLKKNFGGYVWPRKDDIAYVAKKFIFWGPIEMFDVLPLKIQRIKAGIKVIRSNC